MIDFHSHILPKLDDGSKSVKESIKMLRMLKTQGVSKVVATPHFYANRCSVDDFLIKRDLSYGLLREEMCEGLPEIVLGAEVKFYEGISRLENLHKLCIGNSNLLLLEMPFKKWTEYTLKEVREVSNSGAVSVVLAHIDRYLDFQSKCIIKDLVYNGFFIQANADFFINMFTRRKAVNLLMNDFIHFIGSDCHNLSDRPPKMDSAISYIKRKAGEDACFHLKNIAERFI